MNQYTHSTEDDLRNQTSASTGTSSMGSTSGLQANNMQSGATTSPLSSQPMSTSSAGQAPQTMTSQNTGGMQSTMSQQGANIVGGEFDEQTGPGPEVMAASTLDGDDVINTKGETLGKIEDIMLDVKQGRIAYAVLSVGGFLGIGDKLFAIPWSALTMNADGKCFVLDVDKETLTQAPGFDKDHWPAMADQRWASDLHRFYGNTPYWAG